MGKIVVIKEEKEILELERYIKTNQYSIFVAKVTYE